MQKEKPCDKNSVEAGTLLKPVPLCLKAALTKISLKNLIREETASALKESKFVCFLFSSPSPPSSSSSSVQLFQMLIQ